MFFANKVLVDLKLIMGWHNGGIYKRLDENRELLELLAQDAPEFLQSHPWVVNWLKSNDEFLADLEKTIPLDDARFMPKIQLAQKFPRAWPSYESPVQPEHGYDNVDLSSLAAGAHARANQLMWTKILETFEVAALSVGYSFTRNKMKRWDIDVIAQKLIGQAVIKAKVRYVAPLADLNWPAERADRDEADIAWVVSILEALEYQGVYPCLRTDLELNRVGADDETDAFTSVNIDPRLL